MKIIKTYKIELSEEEKEILKELMSLNISIPALVESLNTSIPKEPLKEFMSELYKKL